MKHFITIVIIFLILGLPFSAHAIFKTPPKVSVFSKKFNVKVEELIKAEFSNKDLSQPAKKELLIKRLRELLDKNIKTI